MLLISSRRAFITGLASFVAAPAIVRIGSLMPIRGERVRWLDDLIYRIDPADTPFLRLHPGHVLRAQSWADLAPVITLLYPEIAEHQEHAANI